ncbi:response regulator [Pseudolysobacter antarcticus]|uniref:histidine kinase n=1 Tax=Pseudolysobacter antarcticus TaxID=2511995 RepID=A0A411HHR4_9GAMM|nr:PAS domain-containing protein [Pseudolysobacter antarcticus]QBB69944.1 response regulator [Pseudolysobacter antarcticus]
MTDAITVVLVIAVPLILLVVALLSMRGAFTRMPQQQQLDSFAAIRAGKDELRQALDALPLPLAWHNQRREIEFWNRRALAMFGYAPEEIDTMDKWNALAYPDPDYRREMIKRWAAVEGEGADGIRRDEFDITCKDGRVITVEISGTRDGDLTIVAFNDITERKGADEALRAMSTRLQLAVASANTGIFDWDLVTNEVVWDDAMCRMYGIEQEDFNGFVTGWSEAVHPQDLPRVEAALQTAMHGGPEYYEEYRIRWPDGTEHHIMAYGQTTRDADGRPMRMVGASYDITERKLAEAELRRHRDHLEELVAERTAQLQRVNLFNEQAMDLTRTGYWFVPLDDSGFYTNSDRAAAIYGVPAKPGDWRYNLMEEWYCHMESADPVIAAQVSEKFTKTCSGELPFYDAVYPFLRPVDGKIAWMHAMGIVVNDPKRPCREMYGVVQDITEIIEAKRELEEARAAAEAANQAKSAFLATMSHEIRTPLNAILGMSHLALKERTESERRSYLEKIQRAGQHLLAVINDVLDISKIEAGRLTIETAHFALAELLDNAANVTADRAAVKGLRFSVEVAADVPAELVGDQLRLGQVLINYATNAVKFTERGEITISVSVDSRTLHDAVLRFCVRDTGIGLTADQIDNVFDAFQQGDSSITRRYGGTGLGLAICRNLVRLMGGEMGVDSRLGVGSTFWFTAPVGIDGLQRRAVQLAPDLYGRRFLVAAGTGAESANLSALLTGMRFTVVSATDAEDTITILRESISSGRSFDIVLLDIETFGSAGFAVAAQIKTLSSALKQRIVLVNSAERQDLKKQAERSGYPTIDRPFDSSTLFDRLVSMLGLADAAGIGNAESIKALHGARVLVAEDNEFNQEVARAILGDAGLVVDIADDGEAAVRMVMASHYDAVLMDMQMPTMDGLTATRQIRSSVSAELPIIAMTANAMQDNLQRCLDAGMDDFVAKPIDPDQLLVVLARWIKRRE